MTQPVIPPPEPAPVQPATEKLPEADSLALTEAFKAGQLSLKAGTRVGVRDTNTGEIGTIPAEEAGKAVDAGGELVSENTLQKALLESKYGGATGALGAGAAGFGRGLTFGLSDAALATAGPDMQERLRAYQELHPVASTAGEIAGIVAPALVTAGGAGAVEGGGLLAKGARAAGALNEGVSTLGRGAAGLVERGLARQGAGLLERAAVRGLGAAAEGGVVGAAAGLGSGITHEALKEEDLGPPEEVAARLFAATGHGALLGAAMGGAIGAGAELGDAAIKKAALKVHPLANKAAEESAWKVVNARKAFTERAAEIPGGERAIARRFLDDGVLEATDTIDTLAPKLSRARELAAAELEAKVAEVGAQTVPLRTVLQNLEDRAGQFDKMLGHESAAAAVRRQKEGLATVFADALKAGGDNATVPISDLLAARRSLEGTINWQTEAVAGQGLKAAGRTIEDSVMQAGDDVARKAGNEAWKEGYKAAKLKFRQYALADEAAEDTLSRMHANAGYSLTDKLHQAHGLQTAALGLMSGHPSALLAAGAGAASKFVRQRGSAMTAVAADRIASLGRVKTVMNEVDANIQRASRAFFRDALPKGGFRATSPKIDVTEWQKALSAYKANPGAATERALNAISGVAKQGPNITAAYKTQVQKALTYLAAQMPEPSRSQPANNLASMLQRPVERREMARMNPQDEHVMAAKIQAVTNPESVIQDFARGRVSPIAVQALRETNALLYEKMRTTVAEHLNAHPEKLSAQQKMGLEILFELPGDWSTTPEGIKTYQDAIKINNAEEKQKQQAGQIQNEGTGHGGNGAAAESAAKYGQPESMRAQMRRG